MALPDCEMLDFIAVGNHAMFARFCQRWMGALVHIARPQAASSAEAATIAARALLRLWDQAPAWRDRGNEAAWLNRLVSQAATIPSDPPLPSLPADHDKAALTVAALARGRPQAPCPHWWRRLLDCVRHGA